MEDEILSSSSSDLSGSVSTDEPPEIFIPESESSGDTDSFPPMFNPTPEIPEEYLNKAKQVWGTVSDGAEKVWDIVTGDANTEQTGSDPYADLPNHGGFGREPDDQGIY